MTKGARSKKAALSMAYTLLDATQGRWRRFNGHELVADVIAGQQFTDGIRVINDHTTTIDQKVAAGLLSTTLTIARPSTTTDHPIHAGTLVSATRHCKIFDEHGHFRFHQAPGHRMAPRIR